MGTMQHTLLEDSTIFSERVKQIKSEKRITTEHLADISCLGRNTINSYISRSEPRMPLLNNAMAIAKALGVSLDYLCGINVEKELPNQKEISAGTLLMNLFIAAKSAGLDINTDPVKSTTTFTSHNAFVTLFFSKLQKEFTENNARELAEKYSHFPVVNGQILEPSVYEELVKLNSIYEDISEEDYALYPEETQQMIADRKREAGL